MLSASALLPYQQFVHTLLQGASSIALSYFRQPLTIDNKDTNHFDPVTEADRAIEKWLRDKISAQFAEHGILGEEFGSTAPAAGCPWSWTLDPIDGTRAFMSGLPTWGTLIALTYNGQPVVGGMGHPFTQEIFVGTTHGTFYQHAQRELQQVRVRQQHDLKNAIGFCTTPDLFTQLHSERMHQHVRQHALLLRYGTDCYGYGMLLLGCADYVLESSLQPYDIQAIIPLIEGAGGVVVGGDGQNPAMGGTVCAAVSATLAQQIIGH